MIFDHQLKDRALIVNMAPGEPTPDWVAQADSIRELAEKIEVNPDGLEVQIEKFNKHAVNHEDPDFNRGILHFEKFATGFKGPEANIRPIEKGPFKELMVRLEAS